MGVKIFPKKGEEPERMVKRFKKTCEKAGVLREMRRREFFEKPSDVRRRRKRRERLVFLKVQEEEMNTKKESIF